MPILDRYVLWLFAKVLAVGFTSLVGMYTVIDGFGNLDEFISYGQSHGGWAMVVAQYYGARALTFFDRTSAMLALTAAMFAITWLHRTSELTAIMAAGIPKSRMVKPLVGAAIAVSLAAAFNRELLIPAAREQLTHNAQNLIGGHSKAVHPCYDNATNIFIRGTSCLVADRSVSAPVFQLHTPLGDFGRQLTAEKAVYEPPTSDRPGGYLLSGVSEPENLTDIASASLHGKRVLHSPKDTPWLAPNQCFVATDVAFEQLCGGAAWQQFSSTAQLIAALRNPSLDFGADARVMAHARFVQPLLDISLLFLGLPLVLTRESRNVFVAVGWCLLIVGVFFIVTLGCHMLGSSGLLNPALAAWCPLFIFGPPAFAMSYSLRE